MEGKRCVLLTMGTSPWAQFGQKVAAGQVGGTGVHPAYGASKAGVHALTKTYALEGARSGVLCNAVAPPRT